MNKSPFVIALAAVLVLSVCLNVFVFFQYQNILQANNDLNQQLISVRNELANIRLEQQTNNTDKEAERDFNLFYEEYGDVSIQSRSYNFSPPVSMYHALRIALESDSWTNTSLRDVTVRVSLDYCVFWHNNTITKSPYDNTTIGPGSGFEVLHEVTQPVDDYSPVQVNETTYRYIWAFVVIETDHPNLVTIPPLGLYWVDAATGELISPGVMY